LAEFNLDTCSSVYSFGWFGLITNRVIADMYINYPEKVYDDHKRSNKYQGFCGPGEFMIGQRNGIVDIPCLQTKPCTAVK